MSAHRLSPVSLLLSLGLVAGVVVGVPGLAAAAPGDPPNPGSGVSVPVTPVKPGQVPQSSLSSIGRRTVVWPSAASAVLTVDASGAGALRSVPGSAARVGGLPVGVRAAADGAASEPRSPGEVRRQLQPPPGSVRVSVAGQEVSKAAGVKGVILSLERADGQAGQGRVALDITYSGFRYAFGGDWGPRLRMVRLPECVLSSPEVEQCRAPSVLAGGGNSPVSATVSVDRVDVGAGSTVLALTAGASSDGGDWAASPLPATGTWAAGTQSGDFTYQIPLTVPPAPAGPTPQVALTYSAQSVDGRTVAKNNQTSWVGEGWNLNLGFVERQYKSCRDMERGTDDMCFEFYNLTMSLGGRTVHVLQDAASGEWRMADDSGWRVQRLLGGTNGDNNGEYWRITDLAGTQYYFGVGNRNGIDSFDVSQAVWRMPVWSTGSWQEDGDCYDANFRWSFCEDQAWRWNLDYVVDAHGNTMSLFYQREQIHYGAFNGAQRVTMDRGGYLEKIAYGGRAGVGNGAITAARVRFEVADRCLTSNIPCGVADFPDTPWDRQCLTQTCPHHTVPTFWSAKRLEKVITEVYDEAAGGFNYKKVDQWDLDQIYPEPGEGMDPSLYFQHLTHTGLAGSTPVTYPRMIIDGQIRPNRVSTGPDTIILNKLRVMWIWNGLGKKTTVSYNGTDCTRDLVNTGSVPVDNNTRLCYPQLYTINGTSGLGWFIKYTVDTVVDEDLTHASPPQGWKYHYTNEPGTGTSTKVMWHYDANYFTAIPRRTWSDWRGYANVTIDHGPPGGPITRTATRYYRGLDGDLLGGNRRRHVTLTDTQGNTGDDVEQFRGYARETYTYLDGNLVGSAINQPLSVPRGSQPGYGPVEAHRVRTNHTRARTLIAATNTWRYTRTDTTFDPTYGLPVDMTDTGDEAVTGDETCTRTEYTHNDVPNGPYLIEFPSQITTRAGIDCASGARLGMVQTSYDRHTTLDAPPRFGLPTKVRTLVSTGPDRWAATEAGYDSFGRITSATDARGETTTTAYIPTAGMMPLRQVITNNSFEHEVTTTLDPRRGQPTTVTDPNGKTTTAAYDAMGRLVKVWQPGRPTTGLPDIDYAYTMPVHTDPPTSATPAVLTTKRLGPTGTQITTHAIYDGHGNLKQTQTPAPAAHGGRIITDTGYDRRGLTAQTSTFWNSAAPVPTLVGFSDADVPTQTRHTYDTQKRVTTNQVWSRDSMKWQTRYSYDTNRVTVTPPAGGIRTTTITNAQGKTVELTQHLAPEGHIGVVETTRYAYDPAQRLTKVTDPNGNEWRTTYDTGGRVISTVDPDKGTTTMTYNGAGDLLTTTDARDVMLAYDYDTLGRKTSLWHGAVNTGTKRAEWTYDTLATGGTANGQLTRSTRWHNGRAYSQEVTGFDDNYRPLGTTIRLPAEEGTLAGPWTSTTSYKPDGSVATTSYPAAGSLPAETVAFGYDSNGYALTVSGLDSYVSATTYYPWGGVYERTLGTGTKRVQLRTSIDEATGRLTENRASTENPTSPGQWVPQLIEKYGYDDAGNVKSINEVNPAGTTISNQCYTYDPLRQLTEAWTTTAATCQTTPTQAAVGGPDPYWTSYRYNPGGNRSGETIHKTTGNTTRSYTYPAPRTSQPHTLRTVTTSGASTGTDTYAYDPTGNTTTRNRAGKPGQTLTWDPEGHLESVADGAGTTSYVYTPDGNRLLAIEPTGTTVHLGGYEIRRTTTGLTCTRHYGGVAARTTTTGLRWQATDHHNTGQLTINPTDQTVTRRKTDPFGNPRGATPAWPTTRGFVNGTTDPTGLTHLGAREYDPTTGRFISVDPLMDVVDPQQMHGYTYANSNPATASDPSGLDPGGRCELAGTCTGPPPGCPANHCGSSPQPPPPGCPANHCGSSTPTPGCPANHCGSGPKPSQNFSGNGKSSQNQIGGYEYYDGPDPRRLAHAADKHYDRYLRLGNDPYMATLLAIAAVCSTAEVKCSYQFRDQVLMEIALLDALNDPDCDNRCLTLAMDAAGIGVGAVSDVGPVRSGRGSSCAGNSFDPETHVLMADGTTKPITEVKTGDLVLATNPETGETAPKRVVATITGTGLKHLVDITIDTDGVYGEATGTLTATAGHPFWVESQRAWINAQDLASGEVVRTSTGQGLHIVHTHRHTRHQTVHNLTITDLRTYYVLAGDAAVLVHNTPPAPCRITSATGSPAVSSKTVFNNGRLRVDIENPIPGRGGAANIHVQFMGRRADPAKYYYDPANGLWISERGVVLPTAIANQIPSAAIGRARQYLGI